MQLRRPIERRDPRGCASAGTSARHPLPSAGCVSRKTVFIHLSLLLLILHASHAFAGEEGAPRITEVEPGLQGDLLACSLTSEGLPGKRISLSIQSGLASAIEIFLVLINDEEHVLAENRISLRVAFDLWEEIYLASRGEEEWRFSEPSDLRDFLADLEGLPVAPVSTLPPEGRFRINAGVRLHPVAPTEKRRLGDVVAGEARSGSRGNSDGQEVSVNLGSLIRFIYKGNRSPSPESEARSRWFRLEELNRAPD